MMLALLASFSAVAPGQRTSTDRVIANYQAASTRSNNSADYGQLGSAYLQKARETADLSYYELAEKALTKSVDLAGEMNMAAAQPLIQLAAVYMGEHRFSEAADYAQRALALGSGDLSAFGLLGDAYADMGSYDRAAQCYGKLLVHLPSQEVSRGLSYMHDSRVSYLEFIHGNNRSAADLARRAVDRALEMHMPAENVAWSYFQLGEYLFQAGDIFGAEAVYQQALNVLPGYYRGLSGVAKVRVAEGNYADAIDLYRKAIDEIPIPEYIAALGDIYAKLEQREQARKQYHLVKFIGFLTNLNQHAYNRELALFYADHGVALSESLELAQRELEVRRDVYTEDVLAWSLYKNGKLNGAKAAIDKALSLGTRDALFYYHAGLIYRDLGDLECAQKYLQIALRINPHFHIFYADAARQALREVSSRHVIAKRGATAHED
ncbi:MAG: tetratricopeptide repeat protein [Acidobacteria bacterium]|nr:tetratricopeptide repeat protein [Acidobacteriota bacterium]